MNPKVDISLEACPRLTPGTVFEERPVVTPSGRNDIRRRVFNPMLSAFCLLNEEGADTIRLTNGRRSVAEIVSCLHQSGDEDRAETETAVMSFLDSLRSQKLVILKGEYAPEIIETTSVVSPDEIWFHVTNRCNLRCRTCFKDAGDAYGREMSRDTMIRVIDEIVDMNARRVIVSGGEPLLRPETFEILEYLMAKERRILLITNGTLINKKTAARLGKIRPHVVQVSLDGSTAELNDLIRGKGAYDKAVRGARLLVEQGLDVRLYPTVTRHNLMDLPNMKKLVNELRPGFDHLSCAKFVAIGRGVENGADLEISPEEFFRMFTRLPVDTYSTPDILNRQAAELEKADLNSFVPDRIPYGCRKVNCGIASGTFSIDSDGSVYPCQWLHQPDFLAGNVHDQSLEEIYFSSPVFQRCRGIRVDSDIPSCTTCDFRYFCGGACRARALLKTGDLYGEDPDCFFIKKFFEKGFWAENQFELTPAEDESSKAS